MVAMRSKLAMCKTDYISPEISQLHMEVEQCFCTSKDPSNVNIGIGDWEVEEEDFDIK